MSRSSFCFVHATNVRLDQPMWGTGEVSGEARRLVEEATNLAFENVVETCIKQQASFLLLTGNTLDAAHGHRARILFERACERLARHDCRVFLMPGESDPPHSWRDASLHPDNLTVFLPDSADPALVTHDGVTLATVEPYVDRQHSHRIPHESRGLQIGLVGTGEHVELRQQLAEDAGAQLDVQRLARFPNLVSTNYLALGTGSERMTVGLPCGVAHDPGCPQPLDGRETTELGCTVVEIDSDGQLQTQTIPTSVVRREEIDLHVEAGDSWDDLVRAMQSALAERRPLPSERLWMIRWTIEGDGEVLASLRETETRTELVEFVESEFADDPGFLRNHEIDVKGGLFDPLDGAEVGSIYQEFQTLIDERADEHMTQFRSGLPNRNWPESGWVRHLIETAEQTSAESVRAQASRMAQRHLVGERRDVA